MPKVNSNEKCVTDQLTQTKNRFNSIKISLSWKEL